MRGFIRSRNNSTVYGQRQNGRKCGGVIRPKWWGLKEAFSEIPDKAHMWHFSGFYAGCSWLMWLFSGFIFQNFHTVGGHKYYFFGSYAQDMVTFFELSTRYVDIFSILALYISAFFMLSTRYNAIFPSFKHFWLFSLNFNYMLHARSELGF